MTELVVSLEPAPVIGVTVETPAPIVLVAGQPATLDVTLTPQPEIALQVVPQPELSVVLEVGQGPAGASGGAVSKTAAVDINAYKVVTTDNAGLLIYADAATLTHGDQVLGISAMASLAGGMLMVRTSGELDNPGWNWQPGQAIFLGLAGDITQNPNVGGFFFSLGYATTATSIFIRLGRAIQRA